MIEEALNSPIAYGIAGGATFGLTFGLKAYVDGETFEAGKLALTVVLGGLLGLAFEVVGFQPDAEYWYLILFAFAGLVAEVEAVAKLLVRGHYKEARGRLGNVADEAVDGTRTAAGGAGVGAGTVEDEARRRTPEGYGPAEDDDLDAIYNDLADMGDGPHPESTADSEKTFRAEEYAAPEAGEEETDGRFDFLRSHSSDGDADDDEEHYVGDGGGEGDDSENDRGDGPENAVVEEGA